MAQLDNPAGRLVAILSSYNNAASPELTVERTWCNVLNTAQAELPLELARVCGVLTDLDRVLDTLRDFDLTEPFDHWKGHWAQSIIRPGDQIRSIQSSPTDFDPGSLYSLRLMSTHLHSVASEGETGTDEERLSLRDQIQEAVDEVLFDQSLPTDLRRMVHERLLDILYAIDQFRITGPSGVLKATERLAGSLQMAGKTGRTGWLKHVTVVKALKVAAGAWAFFKLGPEVSTALEGWDDLIEALPVGSDGS